MRSKSLRLLSLLVVTMLVITACAPVAAPAPAAGQPAAAEEMIEIRWDVEWTDPSTVTRFQEYVLDPFEKLHPNIKVKIVQHAGAEALDRDLKAELAAGSDLDIFDTNGPAWVPPYVEAGKALNLDPYAQEFGWQDKIVPFAWQASLVNGSLYSLPAAFEGLILWYNKDLFDQNGWQVPTNYEEIVTLCKDIQSKGLIPFAFGTADCKPCWEWWISYSLGATLGPNKFYKVLTGETPWTDPDVIKAFQLLKDLYQQGFIMDKQPSATSFNDAWGLWGAQKAVMKMEGTWGFDSAERNAQDFEYAIAPLPGWQEKVKTIAPIGIGESVVIYAGTKHPREAAMLFDWMISDPAFVGTWAGKLTDAFVPPIVIKPEQYAPDTNPKVVQAFAFLTETMQKGEGSYVAWTALPAKTDAYAWNSMEDMLLGTISIEEYVAGIQKQFDEEKAEGKLPTVPKPAETAP